MCVIQNAWSIFINKLKRKTRMKFNIVLHWLLTSAGYGVGFAGLVLLNFELVLCSMLALILAELISIRNEITILSKNNLTKKQMNFQNKQTNFNQN